MFEDKIRNNEVEKLTLKEIDGFIEDNWLLWTMKFELSPCGQLTLFGKKEYIENNLEEIEELIKFNEKYPEQLSQDCPKTKVEGE